LTKYIFVTGGVVSSVGKGITAASIGKILKSRNISVTIQKLDPYINVDCGTMSPYQHGEVFVTNDGAETDLDLGHYERFIDTDLTAASSVTTGQIYSSIIAKERRGEFLGGTIQVVPHVTNEIKHRFREVAEQSKASVIIVEVGGTVGDIEGLPFLEAIRQMRSDMGRENILYVHVTLLPYLSSTQELKTKPTQHSVNELRRIGIQPDVIVCRSDHPITEEIRDKIALFCDVDRRAVVSLPTLATTYETPLVLEEAGLCGLIMGMLDLPEGSSDLRDWRELVEHMKEVNEPLHIGIVGKYVELHDSYISVREALRHAAVHHDRYVDLHWIPSAELERDGDAPLRSVQGIIVPGGFGVRGIEGMIVAARYARENGIPYLGLCLGMQVMVIEYARHVLSSNEANSTEFDEQTPYPVIDLLPGQRGVEDKGGTMRLGAYPCHLVKGSKAAMAYGEDVVFERHRHRFEFNNAFRDTLESAGMLLSGLSPDGQLVEISELRDHPFMMGTQFHPEFHSRPNRPHPIFSRFIAAAKEALLEGDQRPLPL
jgi:CTP synthase